MAICQQACMLSGTVVVENVWESIGQGALCRLVFRQMSTAAKLRFLETSLCQDGFDQARMVRLAAVRGNHKGEFLGSKTESLNKPALYDGNHLKRLCRRSDKDMRFDGAGRRNYRARWIDDRNCPAVAGLDPSVSHHLD